MKISNTFIVLLSVLSTSGLAQDAATGSIVQAASVINQATIANNGSEVAYRINAIQNVEVGGGLIVQAAAVENQVILVSNGSCAETTINQIGQSASCSKR